MNTSTLSIFSMATLLTLSGCGAAVDVVSTDDGEPSAATKAGTTEVSPRKPMLSVSGVTRDADGAPLGGVRVCLQAGPAIAMDIGECATSAEDGSFLLRDIPRELFLTIAFEKQGFVPAIRAIRTGTTDIGLPAEESRMVPASTPPAFAGAPLDAKTGALEFFVGSDGAEAPQATVSIASYDDPNASYKPVYTGASGSPTAGATSGSFGAFVGLPSGLYAVTFNSDTGACTTLGELYGDPIDYYQVPGQASILVPVVEGHVTAPVGVYCEGSAPAVAR